MMSTTTPETLGRASSTGSDVASVGQWDYEFGESYFASVPWEEENPKMIHFMLQSNFHKLKSSLDDEAAMQDFAVDRFKALVFFSNRVEDSGLIQSDTYQLLGEIGVSHMSDEQLEAKILENSSTSSAAKGQKLSVRGRREVLQHGAAYQYLCVETIHQSLTSGIVLEAHRRLMRNLTHPDGSAIRAGAYRAGPVYAGPHCFPPAGDVIRATEALFEEYEELKNEPNKESRRDPYSLAAKLSYDFVTIHPFEDGNGRMCRLLLNRVLLEYGVPFPIALGFGFHSRAKNHYLYSINQARKNGRPRHLSTIILAAVQATFEAFFENRRVSRKNPRALDRQETVKKLEEKMLAEQQGKVGFPLILRPIDNDLSDTE